MRETAAKIFVHLCFFGGTGCTTRSLCVHRDRPVHLLCLCFGDVIILKVQLVLIVHVDFVKFFSFEAAETAILLYVAIFVVGVECHLPTYPGT